MDTFSFAPTLHKIQDTQLVQDDWQIQIVAIAICPINFEA